MSTTSPRRTYEPDYAIHPGETLAETIRALGLSQTDLAARSGLSLKHVNRIINGEGGIGPDAAYAFEQVTGVPARFWTRLESNFRLREHSERTREILSEEVEWLKSLPVNELVQRNLIAHHDDAGNMVAELLQFFGVGSVDAWHRTVLLTQTSFRKPKKFESDPGALAAWLRLGERIARETVEADFDPPIFLECLAEIRSVTQDTVRAGVARARELCAEAGVAFVIADEFEGTRANGAARWLSQHRALLLLSRRYQRDDHLWFSFFHEAAHLLLHPKKDGFVDVLEPADQPQSKEEEEADVWATEFLIPEEAQEEFAALTSMASVIRFAKKVGIAPGIVVGQMQKKKIIGYNTFNQLRRKIPDGIVMA